MNMHQAFVAINTAETIDNVITLQNAYHIVSALCKVIRSCSGTEIHGSNIFFRVLKKVEHRIELYFNHTCFEASFAYPGWPLPSPLLHRFLKQYFLLHRYLQGDSVIINQCPDVHYTKIHAKREASQVWTGGRNYAAYTLHYKRFSKKKKKKKIGCLCYLIHLCFKWLLSIQGPLFLFWSDLNCFQKAHFSQLKQLMEMVGWLVGET